MKTSILIKIERFGFFIVLFMIGNNVLAQLNPIEEGTDKKSWTLQTKSSVYQISISSDSTLSNDKTVLFGFYGNKLLGTLPPKGPLGDEVPVRNARTFSATLIESTFSDYVRNIDLMYESSEVLTIDGYSTLVITQKDKLYPFEVIEFIRVLPEYDLIEKWLTVKNTGQGKKAGTIKIENLLSGSIFLPKNAYELTYFSGTWGHEFQPNTTKLTQGLKTIQVKTFKSYGSSFFAVRPEGENSENEGEMWFGSVDYSGNWKVDFDKTASGEVQILGGLNFWDQEINLKPRESFTTPKIIFGYTREGMSGASHDLISYMRKRLPETYRDSIRPVIYNSWFVTEFDVSEDNQFELARTAKDLGAEMFIVDDGWYQSKNGAMSLGDWTVDKAKFPNGLATLVSKINGMGLNFGIWVEPESVVSTSELYKAHPDWIFGYPNRDKRIDPNRANRIIDRYFMLNLAREDVFKYLFSAYYKLLKENNIQYLKWDMNNYLTDAGYPSESPDKQKAARIKYIENLYRLIDTLHTEFPNVWFENCAGGGGRTDIAMMARSDFSWVSDFTDPVDRIFIQYSYLNLFPASTMFNLVTDIHGHKQDYSLEFKFDVAMSGVMGIGANIQNWSEEEKDIARKKIAQYKDIRHIVQFGTPYRLVSPYENNRSVLQFVTGNQTESVVFVYNLAEYPNNAVAETKRSGEIKLKGLLSDALYKIEGINGSFSGDYLMEKGINFPVKGGFKSGIFKLTKQ